jgi:hypothetical protein
MALHLRQQFLNRLAGTTLLNLATTGTRVLVGRVTPLAADASPTLLLGLGPEEINPDEILKARQRVLDRTLDLIVRGAVKVTTNFVETLNAMVFEVETAIAGDQTLGGLAKSVQITAIEEPEIEGQGEKTVAVVTMHFNINYFTALNAPDIPR